ncbi:MAG: hypothetical protein GC205_11465 [Bacteroidetes bacterium]|nr:hypothetical protein [Bacteroidota bacterium]
MIVYEPNKHFISDIRHLARSWTMVKIVRATALSGLYSTVVCAVLIFLNLDQTASFNTAIFSFLGIVLSIMLVFRTNTAYDRWWEGRQQWGALVNNCRNFAIMVHATMPNADLRLMRYFAVNISNFPLALSEHLRQGTQLDKLLELSEEDVREFKQRAHVPNHISRRLHDKVQTVYRAGQISDSDLLNFKPHLQALLDISGACERIRKTPIAFSYAVYIKVFILAYAALLPFALLTMYQWYTIPITMFVFFAFIGVEMMAAEIEDPFGLDCNDLPTHTIAETIRDNVFEILDQPLSVPKHHEEALYEKVF